jgi:VWFA-related protein
MFVVALCAATACAQEKPTLQKPTLEKPAQGNPTLKVSVKVVTMAVTVRDKHGNIVNDLTADDFTLTDNSHPQTIKYFTHNTNLPLTLGLLVDTSGSQRNALSDEQKSSEDFLDQMLTDPKDKAFLIEFAREVDLDQDTTSSKDKLRHALDKMGTMGTPAFGSQNTNQDPSQDSGGDNGQNSGGGHHAGGGTTLYDAIFLASDELMSKQQGRKALIILTDGVDRGSKETLNSAIEAAQRADTVVYAIYFKGQEGQQRSNSYPGMGRHGGMGYPGGGYPGGGYPGGGYPGGGYPGGGYPGGGGGGRRGNPYPAHVDGKKILQQICGQTGGFMYEAKKDKTSDVYAKIAEELRGQYMLGYTPSKDDADAGYHHITLTPKKKDLYVQTRDGYYAAE